MELRDIKLSSILLRTKANKKALRYPEAFEDAKKLWALMNPQERINNCHFKDTYVNELEILTNHYQTKDKVVIDRQQCYNEIIQKKN